MKHSTITTLYTFIVASLLFIPVVQADIGSQRYQYDLNSNITQVITSKGDTIKRSYNQLNQLTRVEYPKQTVQFTYDSEGRRTSMSDNTGTSQYVYDQFGRLTAYHPSIGGRFQYYYNELSQLIAERDPSNNLTQYVYNKAGQLRYSRDFNGRNYYYYAKNGLLISHSRYGRSGYLGKTSYGYDRSRRLAQVTHYGNKRYSYRAIARYYYQYDANDNRTRIISIAAGNTEIAYYRYDGLDRLKSVRYIAGKRHGKTENYSYDAGGNRLSKTTKDGTTHYSYSADNRLLNKTAPDGKVTDYEYDTAGNLITETRPDNTIHYQYDARNLLTQYKDNTQTIDYQYDGDNNRLSKTINGVSTKYFNNINRSLPQVALETDNNLRLTKRYSFGLGRTGYYDWKARYSRDKSQYYRQDYPGRSISQVEDYYGYTRNSYQYSSFGETSTLKNYSTSHNSYQYTTEQYESENQLVYLRARYYNPEIGRFLSRDPFAGWMDKPQSKNMYAYVENNPLKYTDPSGLYQPPPDEWSKAANIAGRTVNGIGGVAQVAAGGDMVVVGGAMCGASLGTACIPGGILAGVGLLTATLGGSNIMEAVTGESASPARQGVINIVGSEYGDIVYMGVNLVTAGGSLIRPRYKTGTLDNYPYMRSNNGVTYLNDFTSREITAIGLLFETGTSGANIYDVYNKMAETQCFAN